jgi:Tol biopolymer transport system component
MIFTMRRVAAARASRGRSGTRLYVGDWSPDVATLDRSRAVRSLVEGPFDARGPVFSPDGRWLA